MRRSGTGRRGRSGSAPRPRFESEALETRRLFGFHTVNGTDGDDTIVVDFVAVRDNFIVNEYHVTLNGRRQVLGGILFLTVRGLDGKDTITVNKTRDDHGVDVFGNSGDDTIIVGGGDVKRNIFPSHVEGDGGNDTVVVDDRGGDTADYRFAVALPALAGVDVHFDGSNRLSLADDVQVVRLLCDATGFNDVGIRENEVMGLDRIEVRGGAGRETLDYVREGTDTLVDFDGGGGSDLFNYSDGRFVPGNRTVVFEPGRLISEGAERATWRNVESIDATVHGAADTVNVNGVAAGQHLSVSAEDAVPSFSDTYNVGNGDVDANILGGLLFKDDGAEPNRYVFNDTAGTTDDAYTVSSLIFQKTGMAEGIGIVGFAEEIVVNANGGDNTIEVFTGLAGDYGVTVNGGLGDDTIVYGGDHMNASTSTLRGQGGNDTIVFNDTGPLRTGITDKDYIFTGGFLRYVQNGSFLSAHAYDAEAAVVNSGPYDSTFTVASTGGEATLTLNGGDGADRLPLVPANAGATNLVFNGQGGGDRVEIDDTGDTIADTYTLTKTTFDKTGFSLLTFGTTETLQLRAHTAVNTFDVNGVAAGTAVTIVAGNSPDTFRVGAGDLDSNISGTLELVGEQGGDTVVFDDTQDTLNDTYRFDGDGVLTKTNVPFQRMQYRFVEHVELNANPGNNTIVVASVGFALDMVLRGFGGADTFDVTPSDRADVRIEASDPTVAPGDVLRFTGAAAAGPAILTPNGAVNGTYAFAFAEPVTFFGVETFPAPPAAPSQLDLLEGFDSGSSMTDNVTAVPSLPLVGRAPAGATVVLFDGASAVATRAAGDDGVFVFFVENAAEGTHSYAAAVRLEPSQLVGTPSAPLVVTVDRTAPTPPDAPDLAATSDTGASNTDNHTRDATPAFTGRAATGFEVFIVEGTRTLGLATAAGSLYSVTTSALADGVHSIRARLRDVAGNISSPGDAIDVTVDTAAPAVALATFTAQSQSRLVYQFSEDVPNLEAGFLTVVDLATGVALPEAVIRLDYRQNTATFTFDVPGRVLPAGGYRATLSDKSEDRAGNGLAEPRVFDFDVFAVATSRRVFANNSAPDGNTPAPTAADDGAVVAGKLPLLPGQSPAFVHVTSYSKGLNGVLLDLSKLPAANTPTVADFEMHVVNAAGGLAAVAPSGILVRRGAGLLGSDRVTLTLPDGTARNAWLRVTVKATANTGLASPDVFFYGNLVGDAGGVGVPSVNSIDLAGARAAAGSRTPAALARFDFNRDGAINAGDVVLVRTNQRRTLPPPLVAPAAAPAPAPAGGDAGDLVTSGPARENARPGRRGVWDVLAADVPA